MRFAILLVLIGTASPCLAKPLTQSGSGIQREFVVNLCPGRIFDISPVNDGRTSFSEIERMAMYSQVRMLAAIGRYRNELKLLDCTPEQIKKLRSLFDENYRKDREDRRLLRKEFEKHDMENLSEKEFKKIQKKYQGTINKIESKIRKRVPELWNNMLKVLNKFQRTTLKKMTIVQGIRRRQTVNVEQDRLTFPFYLTSCYDGISKDELQSVRKKHKKIILNFKSTIQKKTEGYDAKAFNILDADLRKKVKRFGKSEMVGIDTSRGYRTLKTFYFRLPAEELEKRAKDFSFDFGIEKVYRGHLISICENEVLQDQLRIHFKPVQARKLNENLKDHLEERKPLSEKIRLEEKKMVEYRRQDLSGGDYQKEMEAEKPLRILRNRRWNKLKEYSTLAEKIMTSRQIEAIKTYSVYVTICSYFSKTLHCRMITPYFLAVHLKLPKDDRERIRKRTLEILEEYASEMESIETKIGEEIMEAVPEEIRKTIRPMLGTWPN